MLTDEWSLKYSLRTYMYVIVAMLVGVWLSDKCGTFASILQGNYSKATIV